MSLAEMHVASLPPGADAECLEQARAAFAAGVSRPAICPRDRHMKDLEHVPIAAM